MWRRWLQPLPDCELGKHIGYSIEGCFADGSDDETFPRIINFLWIMPDPRNESEPYDCDGEWISLPAIITTSESCEWLEQHYDSWIDWTTTKPTCTKEHYSYSVSDCDNKGSTRLIQSYWLLPVTENASQSSECSGGLMLPESVYLECEYAG